MISRAGTAELALRRRRPGRSPGAGSRRCRPARRAGVTRAGSSTYSAVDDAALVAVLQDVGVPAQQLREHPLLEELLRWSDSGSACAGPGENAGARRLGPDAVVVERDEPRRRILRDVARRSARRSGRRSDSRARSRRGSRRSAATRRYTARGRIGHQPPLPRGRATREAATRAATGSCRARPSAP